MKKYAVFLIALLLCACAPSTQEIQAAIAQTQAVQTAVPTQTPYPTYTQLPTFTEIPTATATEGPNATPPPTETMTPPSALVIGDYGTIDARELQTYADNHKGEKVKLTLNIEYFTPGTDNKELQGYISGTQTEIIVDLVNSASGIYVGDTVTIYGTINGNYSYTSTAGWNMTEPQLINAFYTKP